ncbi:hypothetical protein CYMTET_41094 [Cymbomonas tetramitiformis]|uniref:Uncharacterized protein n=1 Tax=Cymbomonas tetramitiformis TaxID=36881 RepID=A0AAE0C8T3_9CHLO|nr:hypothetical protein CYMTET_41094 [Cymbomonas tetramitiformis]
MSKHGGSWNPKQFTFLCQRAVAEDDAEVLDFCVKVEYRHLCDKVDSQFAKFHWGTDFVSRRHDPSPLFPWKRNGSTDTINFYARFTDEAYETLRVAGKRTVLVQAGVDDRGKHVIAPVVIEVGRWSEKGNQPTISRQPTQSKEAAHLTKAAEEAIAKVEEKAASLIQQVATSAGGYPETKELLKSISKQLSKWGEAEPVTSANLERLHEKQEANADRRHRELKHEVSSFHVSYAQACNGGHVQNTLGYD